MEIYKPESYEKVWGREEWLCNNELYCSKILHLNIGYRCSYHCHKIKDETFYIIEGIVEMVVDDDRSRMYSGDTIRLRPNTYHSFAGITGAKILEVSTQHFENDSYRKDKSGKVYE